MEAMFIQRPHSAGDLVDAVLPLFQSLLRNGLTSTSLAESVFDKTERFVVAAQMAVARLRNEWNHRPGSALDALPHEVWVSILSWVPIRDRGIALLTSRDLRDIAMADPALWSYGEVNRIATLQLMRKRSGSAPFDLHILAKGGTDPLLREIRGDAHRIRTLHITMAGHSGGPHAVDKLLTCEFPQLEEFRFELAPGFDYTELPIIALPDNFADLAPQIRAVVIGGRINVSNNMRPLDRVTRFSTQLPMEARRDQFFTLLPNVRSLSLIGGLGVLPLGPPPRSLVQLRLSSSQGNTAPVSREYSEAFQDWGNHRLDYFELGGDPADGFGFVLEQFTRSQIVGRPFRLDLNFGAQSSSIKFDQNLVVDALFTFSDEVVEALRLVSVSAPLTWNGLTSLSLDRHAILAVVHAELKFAHVTDLTLVFGLLLVVLERHLTTCNWRNQLHDEAGRPRTVSLPSLRRVMITQPAVSAAYQRHRLLRLASGPVENIEYGHGPAHAENDRRMLLIEQLGPRLLRRHIDRSVNGVTEMLEEINICVPLRVATHAAETGGRLTEAYEDLALTCNVLAMNDDVASFSNL